MMIFDHQDIPNGPKESQGGPQNRLILKKLEDFGS